MNIYGRKPEMSLVQHAIIHIFTIKSIYLKYNSDVNLPLNKTMELCNVIIIVSSVCLFYEVNKYYPQISLEKCLYKL